MLQYIFFNSNLTLNKSYIKGNKSNFKIKIMSHHLKRTQLIYKDKLLNYCFGWATRPGYKVKYSVLVMGYTIF